jgi:hypothetical protein
MRLPHDEGSQSAARTRAGGSERQGCDTYWTHRFLFQLVTQFTETTNERAGLGHHRLTFHCHSGLRRGIEEKRSAVHWVFRSIYDHQRLL